jgi:hypothetical protein
MKTLTIKMSISCKTLYEKLQNNIFLNFFSAPLLPYQHIHTVIIVWLFYIFEMEFLTTSSGWNVLPGRGKYPRRK